MFQYYEEMVNYSLREFSDSSVSLILLNSKTQRYQTSRKKTRIYIIHKPTHIHSHIHAGTKHKHTCAHKCTHIHTHTHGNAHTNILTHTHLHH